MTFRALLCALALLTDARAERMSWLDNGRIRLGADLDLGGAITWLSRAGSDENVINSHDWGRQVQMSYYSGPIPFVPPGQKVAEHWRSLGWNPIQAGDHFGHRSPILEQRNDGARLYVKCTPMQWPLDGVPAESTFECWLELDGPAVRARCRLVNARADQTQYPARHQELPAIYTNGALHRIVSSGGEIDAKPPPAWGHWTATERWSALVNEDNWGLGVWTPETTHFIGGFNGKPGAGGPRDLHCGYLAPVRDEILDAGITHEYRYDLVLGTVEEIRAHAQRRTSPGLPAWTFAQDRQGWHYRRATDTGWPIRGELHIRLEARDPSIISPPFACTAADAPVLILDAAFTTAEPRAQLFWSTAEAPAFAAERSLTFPITGDGQFREIRLRPADAPGYRGIITQLRLDPAEQPGGAVRLRSIRFERER